MHISRWLFSFLYTVVAIGFLLLSFISCNQPSTGQTQPENYAFLLKDSTFRYDLSAPDSKFKLKKKLREISGLCIYRDQWLFAVQDEKGSMYKIDLDEGNIEEIIKFTGKGDFEGLASNDTLFFALRADGTIFRIENWNKEKKMEVQKIKTDLTVKNDTEGLAFDPATNSLLIACKASFQINEDNHKKRAVYAYHLSESIFDTNAVCTVSRKDFKKFVKANYNRFPTYKPYKKEMKKAKKDIIIKPSAIAVHPISGHYYILSAISNTLLVVSRQNKIIHIKRLSAKRFEQAEGLAFSSNGDLYISTEGLKKKARIYKFTYFPT